jgi:putative ABC transport system ATP-binding protein
MEIFRRLNEEGITILMITHAEDVAQQAHKIYYIHDGILSSRRDGESQEEVSQQ